MAGERTRPLPVTPPILTSSSQPTRPQTVAILLVGIIGVLMPGLQPVLLGALVDAHRLTEAQLGQAATVELLAMGLAAGLAGAFLKPHRLKLIAILAGLALAAANVGTQHLSGGAVMAVRAVAGAAGGVLIWVAVGMIARTATPEHWAGVYLTAQTLAQLALNVVLTHAVLPAHGADGGFLVLGAICLLACLAAPALPARYPPLPHHHAAGPPPPKGFAALLSILLYLAFLVGVGVYLVPLAQRAGLSAEVGGIAVSVSLAMQVLGGTAATLLAGRLSARLVITVGGLLNLVLLAVFATSLGAAAFIACAGMLGFLQLFTLPFQAPLAIAADPTRRAAMLIAGAQLLGSALGPLLASAAVGDRDVRGVLWVGAACIAASLAITALIRLDGRPTAQEAPP